MGWSNWYDLSEDKVSAIPEKPGVYEIRCLGSDETPLGIPRAAGIDREGIIHIGMSSNLRNRIRGFYRTIQPKSSRSAHAAGWYFRSFRYDRVFPIDRLQFRYSRTRGENEARREEFILLTAYRAEFLDLPPLDNSPGRYPNNWKVIMRKITGISPLDE